MNNRNSDQPGGRVVAAHPEEDLHDLLEAAAQSIGSTLGNLAVKTGLVKHPSPEEHTKPQAAHKRAHQPGAKPRKSRKKK